MTEPMFDTTKQIEEIRERWAKAEPGPWSWLNYPGGAKLLMAENKGVIHMEVPAPLNIDEADMEAIANAPQDIKCLLSYIQVLTESFNQ